jgi:hypothetical protein
MRIAIIGLVASFLIYGICHYLTFAGLFSGPASAQANAALGSSPFFRILFHHVSTSGLLEVPLLPLLLATPVIAYTIAIMALFPANRAVAAEPRPPLSSKWDEPLLRLQVAFVLVALLMNFAAALPLVSAAAGDRFLSSGFVLLHNIVMIVIVHASVWVCFFSSRAKWEWEKRFHR